MSNKYVHVIKNKAAAFSSSYKALKILINDECWVACAIRSENPYTEEIWNLNWDNFTKAVRNINKYGSLKIYNINDKYCQYPDFIQKIKIQ